MRARELQILPKFLDAVTDESSVEKWATLLALFKPSPDQTPKTPYVDYPTVVRLSMLAERLDLEQKWRPSLAKLKKEVGRLNQVLLLHDIGGTLINRDKE